MGETVREVLSTALDWYSGRLHGHNFSQLTDRPFIRPVNNIFIFFQLRFKSFRKIFLHSPTYVYKVGRICVDEAHDRLQIKTKHNNMILAW